MPRDTDLYADSCHRVVATHIIGNVATAAGMDALIEFMADQLDAARWTLADNGVSGGHPFYKFVSAQSPWWDDDPPADYVGKVKVHFFAESNVNLQIQAMTADDAIQQSTDATRTLFQIAFAEGFEVRNIACPYQFAQFYRTASGNFHSALVSALHTPRFIQELREIKETLIASRDAFRLILGTTAARGAVLFSVVKDKDGTLTTDTFDARDNGPSIIAPFSGSGSFAEGRGIKVVNAKDDPTFADPTLWFPFASPAMVAWGHVPLGLDSNRIRAWFWDGIILSESYPLGYTITRPDGTIWEAYTAPDNLHQTLFLRSL